MASNHKVLISGIPPTLNKDALMTMLLEFGDMVTVFVRESDDSDGKKCGYVVYESKLECYRAIAELNEQPPNYLKMRYGGVAVDEGIDVSVKPKVSVLHSALFHGTQAKHTTNSRQLSRRVIHKTWGQVVVGELVESEDTSYHTSRKEHQVTGLRGRRKRGRGVNLRESMRTDGIRDYAASYASSSGKPSPDIMTKSSYSRQFEETEDRCLYCGMVGDNSCSKCGATYCSEICLRKDWSMHKHECVRVKNAGKESSPQSENMKHGKSSYSPIKEECLSESSYRKKSESVSYQTEQDEESDDSRDWLSVNESVDEETRIPPVQRRGRSSSALGPTNSKEYLGKMGTKSLNEKGAVRKRDSMRSEFISEKGNGKFKHDRSPKTEFVRGNTMLKDVAEERDNHLKYNSASPKWTSVKGNSVESRATEKTHDNLNYSAKEGVAKEIAIKSDGNTERKEDYPRYNSNIPGKNVAIDDSVESDARKKRGNHLNCSPTPLEESVKTRISLECGNVAKNENEPSKYTPMSKGTMPMRHATSRDSEFDKKDDCLKSIQSKNGVIKSHVKDTGCDEIVNGTNIERTISSDTPASSAAGFDVGNSFSFDWIKSSVVKSGNDLNSDDSISSPPDKSMGKQTKSQELALHPTKLASPVPEGIEKLIALQNQKKMQKIAQADVGNEPMTKINTFKVPVPAGIEIQEVKKGVNQETQNKNETVTKPARWNLFSDDPETEIAIYDLCTQQKKLPTESFLQVEILSLVKPGEYWVQPFDKEELHTIEKLLRNKKTSQSVFEADLGEYCCVRDGDVWYRGRIMSTKETEFMIALIDFGKVISAKAEQLDDLPPIAKNFYAQAIRVKLDPRTPAEYSNCKAGTVHFMKAKGTNQDSVTNVQLKGILYAQEVTVPMKLSPATPEKKEDGEPSTTDGSQWPSSVLCLLSEGDEASCTVLRIELSEEGYNDEAVVAIGFESIAEELESILVDIQSDYSEEGAGAVCNPVVGDLVAAFSPKLSCWVRSIVLDVGDAHWLVAGIDFGTVEEVMAIRDIPIEKSYRKIHALSAIFKVTSSGFAREDLFCEERIEENAKLFAKVLKKKDDSLECRLYSSDDRTYCYVEMRAWSPKSDCSPYETVDAKKRLPSPPLDVVSVTPGSPVIMLTYFDSLVIYVQPCDAKSTSIMEELHQIITNAARNNIPLKEYPVIGKKYICLYKGDMKYYRAVVERVKSPLEIYVHYIDFGNKEAVSIRHLYEIPSECEEIPCYGVKIELKKDFDNTLNNSARKYLSYLIQDRKVLTLNFPDGDLRSAELLFCGNSLSDNLKTLINSV
ncbi:uncharacterized protein LOC124166644 isoform X2 [Ischnura elegans]|uniref:uncharacterized protein LOC124166644 isoform X2 n=1 Tax=Ischnura elegans TaxID=197161 RepID=UPI001ED86AA0|nr:uncharacterized protein LOC124166644 isoform X2 [Ischnura elegans]